MRVLIALILFMFTLSAAYTLNTAEKPTENCIRQWEASYRLKSINRNLFHLLSIQTACFPQTTYTKYIPLSSSLANGTYNIYSSLSVQTCHAFSKPSDFLYKTGPRFRPGNINRDTRSHRKSRKFFTRTSFGIL